MLVWMALLAAAAVSEAGQRLSRMTALYDQTCLRAFPSDKAVEALMVARNARPLPPEEVKVTLRDDPGRAWEIHDGNATVWIEFPPFHACSVRWTVPDIGDLSEYRAIARKYEDAKGGFSVMDPMDTDMDGIHIRAVGEQRQLPDGSWESLFIFDQHVTDPKRRAAGETAVSLRFVHQFAAPPSPPEGKAAK